MSEFEELLKDLGEKHQSWWTYWQNLMNDCPFENPCPDSYKRALKICKNFDESAWGYQIIPETNYKTKTCEFLVGWEFCNSGYCYISTDINGKNSYYAETSDAVDPENGILTPKFLATNPQGRFEGSFYGDIPKEVWSIVKKLQSDAHCVGGGW